MKSLNKRSLFSLQTLILLSAMVVVDAGSAVQPQHLGLQAGVTMDKAAAAVSVEPKAAKSHDHRCAVWASCNGQRQAVKINHKNALLLAVAGLQQGI